MWKIIDEHYCFFDYKHKEYGLDWNEVHRRYAAQISDSMSKEALFQVLGNLCSELRDGHVNLWTPFNTARYTQWYEAYPTNFDDSLQRVVLGPADEHRTASGLQYKVLPGNVGYIRCSSFNTAIGEGNLHEILRYFALCNALIVDIRSNGGGQLTSAEPSPRPLPTVRSPWAISPTRPDRLTTHSDTETRAPESPLRLSLAKTGGRAHQPPHLQRRQCLHHVHEDDPRRDFGGRPHRRWLWFALQFRTARRMEHTSFGQSHTRCERRAHDSHRPDVRSHLGANDRLNGKDSMIETAVHELRARHDSLSKAAALR